MHRWPLKFVHGGSSIWSASKVRASCESPCRRDTLNIILLDLVCLVPCDAIHPQENVKHHHLNLEIPYCRGGLTMGVNWNGAL